MSRSRAAVIAVLGLRVAYGVGLILAPARLARRWLGSSAETAPTQVPLRALGAREVVLHSGALAAVLAGEPVRPWLVGSIVGDVTDIASTFVGREQLPSGAAPATVLVGGGSALVTAALVATVDR